MRPPVTLFSAVMITSIDEPLTYAANRASTTIPTVAIGFPREPYFSLTYSITLKIYDTCALQNIISPLSPLLKRPISPFNCYLYSNFDHLTLRQSFQNEGSISVIYKHYVHITWHIFWFSLSWYHMERFL